MTNKDLIERLKKLDENKIVIISDGKGWCNIENIEENQNIILFMEKYPLFSDS